MTRPVLADVAVVGAGPAGSAAATVLARAGLRVVLCDKARFPRDKCCGDGLTTGALRRLEALGLDPASVPSFTPAGDLSVRSPSGRIVRVPFTGGRHSPSGGTRAAVARRRELDAALVELARRAGTLVLEGHGFEELDLPPPTSGVLELRLGGAVTLQARQVIGADGAWSALRRAIFGRPGPARADWHAFRTYASGIGREAAEHLWVWFPRLLLPGYAWSFPLAGDRANVGICVLRAPGQHGAELAAHWRAVREGSFFTSLLGRRAVLEEPSRSWPIPSALTPADAVALGGRVLFAGDAVGAADPFTGEGIAQALETGMAAAEAIVQLGGGPSERVGERYREAISATVAVDHRLASCCRRLMAHPLGARAVVRGTGLGDWSARQVGRWLYEDYPRSLLLSPWRYRPGLLSRPAPFAGPHNERVAPRS